MITSRVCQRCCHLQSKKSGQPVPRIEEPTLSPIPKAKPSAIVPSSPVDDVAPPKVVASSSVIASKVAKPPSKLETRIPSKEVLDEETLSTWSETGSHRSSHSRRSSISSLSSSSSFTEDMDFGKAASPNIKLPSTFGKSVHVTSDPTSKLARPTSALKKPALTPTTSTTSTHITPPTSPTQETSASALGASLLKPPKKSVAPAPASKLAKPASKASASAPSDVSTPRSATAMARPSALSPTAIQPPPSKIGKPSRVSTGSMPDPPPSGIARPASIAKSSSQTSFTPASDNMRQRPMSSASAIASPKVSAKSSGIAAPRKASSNIRTLKKEPSE
eukprot:TRINITY_DN8645_c0_g1_i2.p1 TRINITY_DN8645_c0_g1~~TRINITY_DN8645_c0_g1_i2.p1  ORF type:complete len:334 (-),score=63.05 TRINITY_DN8645_c0_g1_i2:16-1017(-)